MSTEPTRPGQPDSRATPNSIPDEVVADIAAAAEAVAAGGALADELTADERLDEAELDRALAANSDDLRADLRILLDPGHELLGRTAAEVDRTLRSRDTVGAALDLLTLGWWTARAVLTDDRRPADAEREGR